MRRILTFYLALSVQTASAAGEASFHRAVFGGDRLIDAARSGAKVWKAGLREIQAEQNALFEKCAPSVVALRSADSKKAGGSGFLIESSGLIVTNAHVVDNVGGIGTVRVRFRGKAEEIGDVVYQGNKFSNDVALIQLRGGRKDYPALALGDSKSVKTGDIAFALGFPHDIQLAFTRGMINGTECARNTTLDENVCFLQSDTTIQHGNSGGPLVNLDGKVIGINSQIPSPIRAFTGINFALPVDKLKETLALYRASQAKP